MCAIYDHLYKFGKTIVSGYVVGNSQVFALFKFFVDDLFCAVVGCCPSCKSDRIILVPVKISSLQLIFHKEIEF